MLIQIKNLLNYYKTVIFSEKKISNLVFQRLAAREKVIKNFSYEVIGEKYKRLYEHTIRRLEGK